MKIKICGMKYPDNIREVGEMQPDYLGFVFFPPSPRYCGEEFQTTINLPFTTINKVGVFVNEPIKVIIRTATKYSLDLVQLHGDESPEYCEELRLLDFKIIKAFGVDVNFDFSVLDEYKELCDYYLFDTKTIGYGGSGERFSWSLLKKYDNIKPIFLSGGLDIDSIRIVHDLLNDFNIHALDFNSKLEIEPGLKDVNKCREVIEAVRNLPMVGR